MIERLIGGGWIDRLGEEPVRLLLIGGALVLALSALFSRRLSLRFLIGGVIRWAVIIAAGVLAIRYQDDLAAAWSRISGGIGAAQTEVRGRALRIRKAPDGHFWVNAEVDGARIRFLIDSGATMTALSPRAIAEAGVTLKPSLIRVQTANGIVPVRSGRIARLAAGPISVENLRIVSAPAFGGINVLGMNFLSALRSWGVEGDWLVLRP